MKLKSSGVVGYTEKHDCRSHRLEVSCEQGENVRTNCDPMRDHCHKK